MGTRSIALCAVVLGLAFVGGCSKPKDAGRHGSRAPTPSTSAATSSPSTTRSPPPRRWPSRTARSSPSAPRRDREGPPGLATTGRRSRPARRCCRVSSIRTATTSARSVANQVNVFAPPAGPGKDVDASSRRWEVPRRTKLPGRQIIQAYGYDDNVDAGRPPPESRRPRQGLPRQSRCWSGTCRCTAR